MLARTFLIITWTEAGSLASRRDPEEMMINERELTSEIDSELISSRIESTPKTESKSSCKEEFRDKDG